MTHHPVFPQSNALGHGERYIYLPSDLVSGDLEQHRQPTFPLLLFNIKGHFWNDVETVTTNSEVRVNESYAELLASHASTCSDSECSVGQMVREMSLRA
jgi:hypothetical protein